MYCSRCGTWTPDTVSVCARCGEPHPAPVSGAPPVAAASAPEIEGVEVVARAPVARVHYAGFWRRLGSMLVDGLLLFFPDTILRTTAGLPTVFAPHTLREDETGALMRILTLMTVVWWLYCALMESSAARGTLGQQLLGIRVGDRDGARISFARASGRYVAQWLSVLICGAGYLFNLWTPRRQTLHDMVSGCVLTVPETAAEPVVAAAPGQPS